MSAKYFAILTNQGAARLANAAALGTKLNLTQLAIGDASGVLPTPDPAQTALVNQRRIAPINLIDVDPKNPSQIIIEQVIPEDVGGYWVREIGLYDDEGILIAVANCPETYKPLLQEGSGRTQTIRMILIVSSTAAVTLRIDPSVVLATRKYADDKAIEVKAYADDLMVKHLAAADPHPKYAQIDSPTFKGTPKAPTPPVISNDTRMATTEFVQAVISALVSGALANKQPLDKTLTDLSGKSAAAILEYLGLGNVVRDTRTINGKQLNDDITLIAGDVGIGAASESTPGIVQISDAINANDSRVAASSAAVYKLLPKRAYTTNDFIRIPDTPGGLMIQWGLIPVGQVSTNYPTPFSNACCQVYQIPQSADTGPHGLIWHQTAGFDAQRWERNAAASSVPCRWFAIGY